MTDYTKNWIEFFRDQGLSDLNLDVLERVARKVNSYYSHVYILPADLFELCDRDSRIFQKVIVALGKAGIVDFRFRCPNCAEPVHDTDWNVIVECQSCGHEYSLLDLQGSILLLAEGKGKSIIMEASYELNALILSKQALVRNRFYYLLCDIEGSEHLQKQDPVRYNGLMHKMWGEYWPDVLLQCQRVYLPLMAKGDACVVAFLEFSDCYASISNLANALRGESFKVSIYCDEMPYSSADFSGFVRGLDSKWDYNSSAVTLFHRRAHQVKPKAWELCRDYVAKVCLLDNLTAKLDSMPQFDGQNINEEPYEFLSKHKDVFKGKVCGFCR